MESDKSSSIDFFIVELLKEKDASNRQLESELNNCRKELQITSERLQQIEIDQNAQLTQSESTTNYLERRIHELDKVFISFSFFCLSSFSFLYSIDYSSINT
jgi:hypothetical protein